MTEAKKEAAVPNPSVVADGERQLNEFPVDIVPQSEQYCNPKEKISSHSKVPHNVSLNYKGGHCRMTNNKESFILFYDLEDQTENFTSAELGDLLRAIFAYEKRGVKPEGLSTVVQVAFSFVAPQLDRNRASYNNKVNARRVAGSKGGQNSAAARNARQSSEASKSKQNDQMLENEANVAEHVPEHVPGCDPGCDPGCVPECSLESEGTEVTSLPTQALHKHGAYGWIQLTEAQYHQLLNDLGKPELDRCINYIDESAQATSNKNGWKDWNIVLQRCHKGGWGVNQQRGDSKNAQQPEPARDASYYTAGFPSADG